MRGWSFESAGDDCADAEKRAGQVLRRRHHAKTQTAGETEGREKSMKHVGRVDIPQEAFLAVLKVSGGEEED